MGLRNILSPTNQQQTAASQVLGGGILSLFEPGTTTFIQAFKDSSLAVPHTQPIRLSGSGRADVWINQDCDLQLTDRNANLILFQENANPDSLGATASGSLLTNGSFEDDTNADGTPDSWVLVDEAGSTNARDTSESTDGGASFRFTSSGVGGGNLTSENFFPVNDVDDLRVTFDLRSTVAAVRNIVRVEWYDVSQISISDSDPYDSTANPLTYTGFTFDVTPPALARFAKIKIIGIDPSVALAGSTFVDNVQALYPAIVAGVFDNIEIRNNEIISLNTNGEIDIKPDGTGPVNVISSNAVDLVDVNNPLNVGQVVPASTNPHLAIDVSQIQGKTDATSTAGISINPLGGDINIGQQTGADGDSINFFNDGVQVASIDSGTAQLDKLNLSVGDNTVATPSINVISTAAGSPIIQFTQDATLRAFIQYLDVGDILSLDSDGAITLSPANLPVLSLDTSQNTNLLGSLYLAEKAAGGDVADNGQLYVNASNELIYRDEGGTETNLLTAGGTVGITGTPVDNQVAIWTSATDIEGVTTFTHNGGFTQIDGANARLVISNSLATINSLSVGNDRTDAEAASFFKNVANATDPVLRVTNQNTTGADRDAVGIYIDNEQGEAIEINFDSGGIIFGEGAPHHTHGLNQSYGTMFVQSQLTAGLGGQNKPMWRDGNNTEIAMTGIREDIEDNPPAGSAPALSNFLDDPKRVTCIFTEVTVSLLTNIIIRVGDATGGTDTAGYTSRSWATSSAGAVTTATFTNGYNIQLQSVASSITGRIVFEKIERGADNWTVHGTFIEENGGSSFKHEVWGTELQNDYLDRIVPTVLSGVFNGGIIQVLWEA